MNKTRPPSDISDLYENARSSRSFSRILHRKMLEKGWRNSDLVRRMNDLRPQDAKLVNRQLITSYTSGRSTPPMVTALLIAQALECDLADLLSNTDQLSSSYSSREIEKKDLQTLEFKIDRFNTNGCYVHLKIDLELPISVGSEIMTILRKHFQEREVNRPVSFESSSERYQENRPPLSSDIQS